MSVTLRKETNLYDDLAIKSVNDKVISQYAVSTTPSSTVAKTATVDGTFALFKNARVSVFFQNANTSTSPTLNVAGTGAKPIWAYGGPLSADGNTFNWVANSTIEFVYDGEHWLVADSGAVGLISKYDEKLSQEVVFNKLTNNGAIRGIFMKDGQMYINMDYLQTGTLKLGGTNNGNGLLVVYDASGTEIGRWSKDGINIIKGTFSNTVSYHVAGQGIQSATLKYDEGRLFFIGGTSYRAAIGLVPILKPIDPGHQYGEDPRTANLCITVASGLWMGLNGSSTYFFKAGSDGVYIVNLHTSTSSMRFKHDISDKISPKNDAHKLYELKMKQFVYNDGHSLQYADMKGQTLPGFIAEDVAKIYPAAVIHDGDGNIESWDERRIIPGMLALIQEQHEEIAKLKQVIHVA